MLISTELIVLQSVRYSDTSSIVHTYSEQLGSLSFKVSRPTRRKSGGARAFFTPLSILEVSLDHRPMRQIHVPRDVQTIHTLSCISSSPVGNAVALFCTELLSRLLRTDSVDAAMYSDIRNLLLEMDTLSDRDLTSFHIELLLHMVRHLGISPQTEGYQLGYVLNIPEGRFEPPRTRSELLTQETSGRLYQCLTASDAKDILHNKNMRNDLMQLLLDHLRFHYPAIGDMRSPQILKDLF